MVQRDAMQVNPMRVLRLRTKRGSFTTAEARKRLAFMRRNSQPLQLAHTSRIELHNQLLANAEREQHREEIKLIEGHQTRMQLPPHMQIRHKELQELLGKG